MMTKCINKDKLDKYMVITELLPGQIKVLRVFDLTTIDQRSKTLSDKCLRKPEEPSPATAPEEFVNGDRLKRKPMSE